MSQAKSSPPTKPIPYSRPTVSAREVAYARRALRSGWLTTGPTVAEFEQAFARKVGAKFAVSFSSGTAALVGAAAAVGVGPGTRIVTSSLSFAASANCGMALGAEVDFADVDPATLNLSPGEVRRRVRKTTRAVVAVHYAGLPADLRELRAVCRERGIALIEDAAHALGAEYRGTQIGDCRYSDLCCFSFHPTKLITCGEGGMVTTNRRHLAEKLRVFRNHGITRPKSLAPWEYDVAELSLNWRLSDIHSAIGLAQLERMDAFLVKRRRIAEYYARRFADVPEITVPTELTDRSHAYHIYVIRVDFARLSLDRQGFYTALRSRGILLQAHYRPIHLHSLYRCAGHRRGDFPLAEAAYDRMFSLPMYPGLTAAEMRYVADTVIALIERNRREG